MGVLAWLSAVFAFRTLPVTILALSLYIAIFISTVWIHEVPPSAPRAITRQRGLDLDKAWKDLQSITASPHPYNSHSNDDVRKYILSRVSKAASDNRHHHLSPDSIQVSNDLLSNATYAGNGQLIYFEGNNIVVKIDGTQSDKLGDAVLFSAHFDSVSTAPGATDDGMGVVTLLNLIDYFAANPPKRTVVFNINNGEEDWLNGAHAFLEHPYATLPKTFLNLEGAGSAGRPLFFRTSNTAVTKAVRQASHPHGSTLSSDAFKARLVRSGTDFEIYENAGLKGLDLAFYRKRSRYHTKWDSVSSLGGKASLWAMMETALQTGKALVNTDGEAVGQDHSSAVYFDLFGVSIVVLSLNTMLIINAILLGAGPLAVGFVLFVINKQGKLLWTSDGWLRLPACFGIASSVTIGLGFAYAYLNPYIIYSSSYAVLVSLLCAFYVTLCVCLKLLSRWRPLAETPERSIMLFESHVLWWILLLLDTTAYIGASQLGGLYFITFFYAGSLSALLVSLSEMMLARKEEMDVPPTTPLSDDYTASHSDVVTDHGEGPSQPYVVHRVHDVEADANEHTPLLNGAAKKPTQVALHDNPWAMIMWSFEMILSLTFPTILLVQLVLLVITGLSGTLADGNPPKAVYTAVALCSVFIMFPLAPFIHKMHRIVLLVLSTLLALTVLYNLFAFPFSTASPLKIYFQQRVNLDKSELGAANRVILSGVPHYLEKYILPEMPSATSFECEKDGVKAGLVQCTYKSLRPRVVPGLGGEDGLIIAGEENFNNRSSLLTFNATRLTDGTGLITIRGENTRNCRLYFDDPITGIHVKGGSQPIQKGYEVPSAGVREVRLWSRTWDREFEVQVSWEGKVKGDPVKGKVACEWAELREGRIPALDEVIAFLPNWAVVTKYSDGLVEGYKAFEM